MIDRPILFSSPMVRSIIEGRKTKTRRVIAAGDGARPDRPAPNYAAGDRLWVREAFIGARGYDQVPPAKFGNKPVWYCADGEPDREKWWHLSDRKRPGIHLPRFLSRITLTIECVTIERLQDITEAEAKAEGCDPKIHGAEHGREYTRGFIKLWNGLNEDRGYGWKTNPWVVAVTFTYAMTNIDNI